MKRKALVTNDDGFLARGLWVLAKVLCLLWCSSET